MRRICSRHWTCRAPTGPSSTPACSTGTRNRRRRWTRRWSSGSSGWRRAPCRVSGSSTCSCRNEADVTTKGIDFGKLSLKDALDLAVLIEEEARDRYEEFVDQMRQHRTPEASRFFAFMAGNEEKHRAELAERGGGLFEDQPGGGTRGVGFGVGGPGDDGGRGLIKGRGAGQGGLPAGRKGD